MEATHTQSVPAPTARAEEELPKLSAADFRTYNRMAEHMNYFHEHFRTNWTTIYAAASIGSQPAGMSIKQYMNAIDQFLHNLEMHHSIEEQHIFPILARKMPAFRNELELLTQHKQIHKGMAQMEAYVTRCRSGEDDFRMGELKAIMDGFGDVLWTHLNEEVNELRAENMRKYWTKAEMARMQI